MLHEKHEWSPINDKIRKTMPELKKPKQRKYICVECKKYFVIEDLKTLEWLKKRKQIHHRYSACEPCYKILKSKRLKG